MPYQYHNTPPIPCYQLPFEEAESLERPETLLKYCRFVILKDYFAVKRFKIVLNSNIPSTLIFAHDPEKIEGLLDPSNSLFTTKEVTNGLSEKIRGFWSLEHLYDQKVKLPAFYGHLLAKDLTRTIRPIAIRCRNYVVGKKASDPAKHFAPRYYILNNANRTFIDKISLETEKNLLSLVKDRKFYDKCKRNQELFRQKKHEERF